MHWRCASTAHRYIVRRNRVERRQRGLRVDDGDFGRVSHHILVMFQCVLSDEYAEVELLVRFADEKGQGSDACALIERHLGRTVQSECEIEGDISAAVVD